MIILNKIERKQKTLIDIIKYILAKELVHYSDIIEYTQKSRKTVARYLDEIDQYLATSDIDVRLVRKRNVGIYFVGDISQLQAQYDLSPSVTAKEARLLEVLLYLIDLREYQQLQVIAESLFISKSTLEKDLDILKKKYGLRLRSNTQGILIDLSEVEIRNLISSFVKDDLKENLTYDEEKHDYHLMFTASPELLRYVDEEHLRKVEKTLATFITASDQRIDEYEYASLLIHTAIALRRIMDGDYLETNEFKLGKLQANTHLLVAMLESDFSVKIPRIEQGYLDLHILAIENEGVEITNDLIDKELKQSLKHYLVEHDELLLKNLLLHLTLAIKRSKRGMEIKNPYEKVIMKEFPEAVDQARNLLTSLSFKYPVRLNNAEITYTALHLQAFKERRAKKDIRSLKLAVICSTGYGTAAFLKQRLQQAFGERNLQITSMSIEQLTRKGTDADLIVTTIPIKTKARNVIQISPLVNSNELILLEKAIESLEHKQNERKDRIAFMNVIDKECILPQRKVSTADVAIKTIVKNLEINGYVDKEMEFAALEREHLASTSLGRIAIPHGDLDHVKYPVISILTNESGVSWSGDNVKVVFFIALNKEVADDIDNIYSYFYDMISDEKRVERLAQLKTSDEIFDYLRKWDR